MNKRLKNRLRKELITHVLAYQTGSHDDFEASASIDKAIRGDLTNKVRKGLKYWDANEMERHKLLDLQERFVNNRLFDFDMANPNRCLIGHAYADYLEGTDKLRFNIDDSYRLGFSWKQSCYLDGNVEGQPLTGFDECIELSEYVNTIHNQVAKEELTNFIPHE